MEIIKDNSKSIDIVCLHCGSVLRAKEGEISTDGTERSVREIANAGEIIVTPRRTKIISKCPCCQAQNPEVLYLEEKEKEDKFEDLVNEVMVSDNFTMERTAHGGYRLAKLRHL